MPLKRGLGTDGESLSGKNLVQRIWSNSRKLVFDFLSSFHDIRELSVPAAKELSTSKRCIFSERDRRVTVKFHFRRGSRNC